MTLNLAVLLEESAKEKPALIFGEHELTYADLRDTAKRFANVLTSLVVEPVDNAALMLPNLPQFESYCKNSEAAEEAMRGGWFHTGDRGDDG